jgi:ribosome-binding ATPase YchF (GTP1/OBG family)
MGLLDRFRPLFGNEKCERTIRYDTRTIDIGNVATEVPPVKFSLGDFKTEVQKIRDASEFSELLDSYQYQMCKICKALGEDDEEWKKYNKIRIGMINLLTSFQGTLIAFKTDPESQKTRLNDIVERLQDYVLLVNREILPNISELESKTTVSKGDVSEVNSRTVSKALQIGGLEETEVNQFIEELKSQ